MDIMQHTLAKYLVELSQVGSHKICAELVTLCIVDIFRLTAD